ncbi:MAG: hypothetical protein ABIE23_03365 [archaeon]
MNLKEFFYPTKERIILAIIVFLVFPMPQYVIISCGSVVGMDDSQLKVGGGCPPSGWTIIPFFGFQLISKIVMNFYTINLIATLVYSLTTLIISYLISCIIIFAYNKFKERKK